MAGLAALLAAGLLNSSHRQALGIGRAMSGALKNLRQLLRGNLQAVLNCLCKATATAFALPRRRSENELTGLGG